MFAERVETQRANLRASVTRFGQVRQGTGAEIGLDTSDVIALVQSAGPEILLIEGPDDNAYVNLRQLLSGGLEPALAAVKETLFSWHQTVGPLMGQPDGWRTVQKQLREVEDTLRSAS